MLESLHVHGFRTLFETEVHFDPLTIMIGKNGSGKTSILDALQLIGNFARGGVDRAFGPPPWSLAWQRSKGIGHIHAMRFEAVVRVETGAKYKYSLSLDERNNEAAVTEERLLRLSDHYSIASFSRGNAPPAGTILVPGPNDPNAQALEQVARIFKSVVSYELNPSEIEKGTDAQHDYIGREGFGVPGFLANLKDRQPEEFQKLATQLKRFRPETKSLEIWSTGKLYWGFLDQGHERPFPACHLSWGDRQLVGLLCVLYDAKPESTIAVEEIDRGFHHSRYVGVIDLLSEAAYKGLDGHPRIQIVVTTHSSSFINKMGDRLGEIRMVTRVSPGGTIVRPLEDVANEKLGTTQLSAPLGEVWEMGLLEDVVQQAMV
jgi:predicted ATPase